MATDAMGEELPDLLPDTDCAGCAAPCCSDFTMGGRFQALVGGVVQLRHWRRYDADLRVIAVERRPDVPMKTIHFGCTKLVNGRCAVYDHRPYACIVYDCRTDPGRMHGADAGAPHCRLPPSNLLNLKARAALPPRREKVHVLWD
ncbi:MAG: hypothetical protein ACYDCQ_22145 [Dehalococcoidia bacterium]